MAILFDSPLETASEMLQRYGRRGKINPFGPSLEQDLSDPIKRVSGIGSGFFGRTESNPVPDPARRCP